MDPDQTEQSGLYLHCLSKRHIKHFVIGALRVEGYPFKTYLTPLPLVTGTMWRR